MGNFEVGGESLMMDQTEETQSQQVTAKKILPTINVKRSGVYVDADAA